VSELIGRSTRQSGAGSSASASTRLRSPARPLCGPTGTSAAPTWAPASQPSLGGAVAASRSARTRYASLSRQDARRESKAGARRQPRTIADPAGCLDLELLSGGVL